MPVGAIVGSTVASVGATAIGAKKQSKAAKRAAETQAQASDRQAEVALRIHNDNLELQQPAMEFHRSAMNPLADLLGLDYQYNAATGQGGARPTSPSAAPVNPLAAGAKPGFGGRTYTSPRTYGPKGFGSPYGGMDAGFVGAGQSYTGNGFNAPAYLEANPDVGAAYAPGRHGYHTIDRWAEGHWNNHGHREGRSLREIEQSIDAAAAQVAPVATQEERTATALDALKARPGYQFRLNEGLRALDASAAARGMIRSGDNIKGVVDYSQDYASGEYGNAVAQLSAIAAGQATPAAAIQNSAQNYGNTVNAATRNAANAQSSAYQQQGAISANAFNNVGNAIAGGVGAYGGYKDWWG